MSLLQRFKPKSSGDNKSSQRNSVSSSSDNRNTENVSEGFLCPECRIVFNDPEALQKHFLQAHSVESTSSQVSSTEGRFVCPQCMTEFKSDKELRYHFSALHELSENRDGDVLALRLELNDLRASLKEEKWYSEELKKEMDKLHSKMQENFRPIGDLASGDEIGYYLQQIQALEAGKALVTSKMLETEKQLSEAQRNSESAQRERNRFLEKSTNLSQELASAMSQLDELNGHKIALTENLTKLQEKIVDLEAQLNARPSEDDVLVLRKELVHAQTLMDQMSKESENEAAQWQLKCSQLETKCSEYEDIVKGLTQKMDQEDFHKLKQQSDSLEQQFSIASEEKKNLLEDLEKYKTLYKDMQTNFEQSNETATKISLENESIKKKLVSFEKDLKKANEIAIEKDKKFHELSENYENLKATFDTEKSTSQEVQKEKLSELEGKKKVIEELTTKTVELEKQLSLVNAVVDELNQTRQSTEANVLSLKDDCETKERKYNEVQLVLEKVRHESDALNERIKEMITENENKEKTIDELKATSRRLETKLDEFNHEIEKKSSKITELESLFSRLTDEKDSLLKEKKELFEKLQAGEEGVTTALQQLTTDKAALEQRIFHLEGELVEERKKNDAKCDQFQQTIRETKEKLKEEQDICVKLKNTLATNEEKSNVLNNVVVELKKKLETQANTISSLERDEKAFKREFETKLTHSNEVQAKASNEIDKLNEELKKRNETIAELKKLVEDLSGKFEAELKVTTELNKKLNVLETTLNEKIKEAEKWLNSLKEAETKAEENTEKLVALEQSLKEWKEKHATVEVEREKLSVQLSAKEQEIQKLIKNCQTLNEEKVKLEKDLNNLQTQSTKNCDDLKKDIANLESALNKSNVEHNKLQDEIKTLTISKEDLSKIYNDLTVQLKERDQVCARQSEEAALTSKKSQQIVEELKTECLQLKKRLDENIQTSQRESGELTLLVSGLETTVNDLKKQIKDADSRENELKTLLELKTNESDQILKQSDIQKQKVLSLEQEICSLQTNIDQLKSTNRDLENNLKISINDVDQLRNDRESMKNQLDSSAAEISAKEEQLKNCQSNINELKEEIQQLSNSVADLTSKLKEVQDSRDALENERVKIYQSLRDEYINMIFHFQNQVALCKDIEQRNVSYVDLNATKIQLENLLKDLRQESESELANQKMKTQRLETERNELTAKCRLLEDQQTELEERLSNCQNDMKQHIESSESMKKSLENECQSLKSQLADIQSEKHQTAKEYSIKLTALENSQYNLGENLSQIQKECDQLRTELETTKKELKVTLGAKQDLEAQLGAWSEEKRMLLERCLMFEKDVDEEKDNGRELKRRLDDAISAMHELGRENQSLQIDMSKHVNRKWADDNEAFNCNACGKQFSVTVRKHHCRHCGMIFCNDCSNKTSLVASAKKPVRVCDNCYVELNGRQ